MKIHNMTKKYFKDMYNVIEINYLISIIYLILYVSGKEYQF